MFGVSGGVALVHSAEISVNVHPLTHVDVHGSRSDPAQGQEQQGDGGLHVNASVDAQPLALSR